MKNIAQIITEEETKQLTFRNTLQHLMNKEFVTYLFEQSNFEQWIKKAVSDHEKSIEIYLAFRKLIPISAKWISIDDMIQRMCFKNSVLPFLRDKQIKHFDIDLHSLLDELSNKDLLVLRDLLMSEELYEMLEKKMNEKGLTLKVTIRKVKSQISQVTAPCLVVSW